MAPIAASGPTPVSMASAEQVITLQSDGNFVVEGSRECCPDGSADAAIWDIGGKKGRNTLEYRIGKISQEFLISESATIQSDNDKYVESSESIVLIKNKIKGFYSDSRDFEREI